MPRSRAAVLAALPALALVGVVACATDAEQRATDRFARAPVPASPAPSDPSDSSEPRRLEGLRDLLAEAALRSPALRAAYHDWQAAVRGIPAARRFPELQLSYTGFILPVQTRLGPQEHKIGVAQPIPWPTKLSSAADAAAARAEAARVAYEALRLKIFRAVRRPWAQLAFLQAQHRLLGEQMILLKELLTAAQARQAVDTASYAEVTRVTLTLAELEDRRESVAARQEPLKAAIRAAVGLPPDAPLPVAAFEDTPQLGPELATLREELKGRPEVRVASAQIEAERASVEQARTVGLPDFMVGVDWVLVGAEPGVGGPDAGTDAVMGMVGVKVPLSRGAYDAMEASAEARVRAAQARREAALREGESQLAQLASRIDDLLRHQTLYEKTLIPQTQAGFEAALSAYSADRGTAFSELFGLARQLLAYQLELERTRMGRVLAHVELELLLGRAVQTQDPEGAGAGAREEETR